jgi:hypothetical protein
MAKRLQVAALIGNASGVVSSAKVANTNVASLIWKIDTSAYVLNGLRMPKDSQTH